MAAFENTLAPVALSPIVMQAEALGVSGEQIQTFLLPVEASTIPSTIRTWTTPST